MSDTTRLIRTDTAPIGERDIHTFVKKALDGICRPVRKALIIPPDFTRSHSYGGKLTAVYYELLKERCEVTIMPALGTHVPLTETEIEAFFGPQIPKDCFAVHHWRRDIERIGEVPGAFVEEATGGLFDEPIAIEINKLLLDPSFDLIVSIGQVVPHVVAGMANYSKNILVGCGGRDIINRSHFIGAVYGMERLMGRADNPVRKIFDYAQEHFLNRLSIQYVLTVTNVTTDGVDLEGVFAGTGRDVFEEAARYSVEKNIFLLDKPIRHVVAYLDEEEFKSTWLGNKAIYRTRMAIADGGRLTILAPGVKTFGEDSENDRLIRKYGYVERETVMKALDDEDIRNNLAAAAHLIHGATEGRFTVEYAVTHLSREEVEGVNYTYAPYAEAVRKYNPDTLNEGYNTVDGEEIYFVKKPALGLWACREIFEANA